jgi:arylsulfatase A-like enzyme
MLKPITEWIEDSDQPFFAALMCSVTHDPYVVPEWFGMPADDPIDRYRQSIQYTDKFLSALYVELTKLGLVDETIFCVIGDHGEAFGEHGLFGHERIAFEELLHIPFCLRAPFSIEPGRKIAYPVSSVDLTPTLLGLLGFETESAGFDGIDLLAPVPEDRKVYFSGWMREGPAGYVQNGRKFVYHPTEKTACLYNIQSDPRELVRIELPEKRMQEIVADIVGWRTDTVFRPSQVGTGRQVLFDRWFCRWTDRVSSAKYKK